MYEFAMPSLGADMEDGTFIEWHVRPGDSVERGQVVCVVETEKGAVDVEIWESGTMARLVAEPDQKIRVGGLMGVLATAGEDWHAVAASARTASPEGAAAAAPVPPAARSAAPGVPAAAPARTTTSTPAPPGIPGRYRASPAARKRAHELDVDLAMVVPAGTDGVISIADIERAAAIAAAAKQPPVVAEAAGAAVGATQAVAGVDEKQAAMRNAIATAMSRSKREIPHYYLGTEISVERAAAWLEARNAAVPIGERVLFAALELKAVALALRATPELNGFFVNGEFRPGAGIHLGVAVSLRGGGLVAPALHDADKLGLAELMSRLKDLLKRARSGQLRSSERADPTITITNLGDLGVDNVYGVIQPPQVALVGMGRVSMKPWVKEGAVVPARVLHATLSADHRVSDGMRGARFLAELDRLLQQPEELA
jgi:pyruvate dehydrogenase E2 component (dihydrolipoamide acetyltransferase)